MALEFPKNESVFDTRVTNSFGRVWLGFLEAIYRKFKAVDVLTNISTTDVGAAGATYSQAYANEQTALINELKAKVNALQNAAKT